jgi:hypothetical protein
MSDSEPASDLVGTFIAVLIALVSVIAAVGAWRVAVATSNASDADTGGLLAAVDREETFSAAHTAAMGRLFAYSRAVANDAIADALEPVETSATDPERQALIKQERDSLTFAASQLRSAIPQQYIDRLQIYDVDRDIGETTASLALDRDTFPEPHFARADDERAKAEWLLLFLIVLGAAFVLLTMADAIKNPLRYVLLALSILCIVVAVMGGIVVELRYTPL